MLVRFLVLDYSIKSIKRGIHKMEHSLCDDFELCLAPKCFLTLGIKWAFPILCRLKASREYSFEDIVRLTHRNVHRGSLSKILKKFISLGILLKKDGKYELTKRGIEIQRDSKEIGRNIISPKKCSILNS